MAQQFEYKIIKAGSHNTLGKDIDKEARDGWEPINVYAWNKSPNFADHGALLRRARS